VLFDKFKRKWIKIDKKHYSFCFCFDKQTNAFLFIYLFMFCIMYICINSIIKKLIERKTASSEGLGIGRENSLKWYKLCFFQKKIIELLYFDF